MKRLSLCLMAIGVISQVRAADPVPDKQSALPAAAAPIAGTPVGGDSVGPAVSDNLWSDPGRSGCGKLIGGAGVYIIQPFFQNNPAYVYGAFSQAATLKGTSNVQTNVNNNSQVDFGQHATAAPEFWLGYMGQSGLGFRSRFWNFRQGSQVSASAPPGVDVRNGTVTSTSQLAIQSANPAGLNDILVPAFGTLPTQFAATSKLQLLVIDNEIFQDVRTGNWDILLSGGVRYAHIAQSYNAYMTQSGIVGPNEFGIGNGGAGSPGSLSGTLLSGHSFNGFGPLAGLEVRRFLGNSGLALYGKGRGAFLFGSGNQTAFSNLVSQATGTGNSATDISSGAVNRSTILPVLEGELGLEMNRTVGRSVFFGQVGAVAMNWFNGGSASNSFTTGSTNNDFGFLGFVVRLGFNY